MTRGEAITIIQNRLGQRTGLSTQIAAELQLKQVELEHAEVLPWFLLKTSTGLVTVAGTQTVTPPTDFLRESGDSNSTGSIWLTTTDGSVEQLIKDYYDVLKGSTWLAATGQPTHYALMGSLFYLFPKADLAYALTQFYYGADTVLSTDGTTNLWLANAPDLLIAETGVVVAKFLRDQAAIQLFADDLNRARNRMRVENIAREQAAMSLVMGG